MEGINKVIGDGLLLGDNLDKDKIKTLQDAGIDIDKYFSKMADGTYTLTNAAEDFSKAVKKIAQEGLLE
jgi:hypothetical protein